MNNGAPFVAKYGSPDIESASHKIKLSEAKS